MTENLIIKPATENDIPLILHFIKELAKYENLLNEVVAWDGFWQKDIILSC